MSAPAVGSAIIECSELFKNVSISKVKEGSPTVGQCGSSTVVLSSGHTNLRRSYSSLVNLLEQHRKLDRSIIEPTSRYKTELCRPFEESGSCKYGDKCQFAHGYVELRNLARHPKYKTELCRTFHKIGFCPYGPRCHFVHNFEEARISNLKLSLHICQAHSNFLRLGSLLTPGTNTGTTLSASLFEQVASSSHLAALHGMSKSLMHANSLTLKDKTPIYEQSMKHTPLHCSNSICVSPMTDNGASDQEKPLTVSPAFSLGSRADSISPSSSLSQSPTNSMGSFFSDEVGPSGHVIAGFGFNQELSLLTTQQCPSPQKFLPEDLLTRTPSPIAESRLPVFNRISSTLVKPNDLRM